MKLLRNFDKGNQYLNINTNEIIDKGYDSEITGWYKLIGEAICGLIVSDSNLYLMWKKEWHLISDSSNVVLSDKNSQAIKSFSFYNLHDLVFSFDYKIDDDYSMMSPFEYIDYENYDWGVFVSNIVNSSSRRNVFISNLKSTTD